MDLDTYIELEQRRAEVYRCLSTCYYLPERATLDQLEELEDILEQICKEAVPFVAQMRQTNDLDRLKVDFSQLFVGPFKLNAPPYGSVYLERQRAVMGASTVDAEKRYREAGLNIAQSLNDAPDHIAIELEFLYFLIFKEIEAIGSGQMENADEWLRRRHDFLALHLGAWISDFADAVERGAKTDFYQQLAGATRLFVLADREAIVDTVSQTAGTTSVM